MLNKTLEFKNDMLLYGRASFDDTEYTLPTLNSKIDHSVDDTVSIQDKSNWNDTERYELVGSTELGYQDGILKYKSAGEITYTGKESLYSKFIVESMDLLRNCKQNLSF